VETEHDSVGGETSGGYLNGKAGVDAKLAVTPTLTADVTVHTDFAQVEADQQVINLTRFPFFFPEKREFFSNRAASSTWARRAGCSCSIRAASASTRAARPCRSSQGDGSTDGSGSGSSASSTRRLAPPITPTTPSCGSNTTCWSALTSAPSGRSTPDPAAKVSSGSRRTGIWETTGHSNFMPRPHTLGIRQLDFKFIPEWDIITNSTGSLGRSGDWQTAWFEWRFLGGDQENGDRFEVNFQRVLDAPTDTFDIFRAVKIPPGRYWWSRYELQYFMSPGRRLGFGAFMNGGAFYGGRSFVQYNNDTQRADVNLRFHWIPQIGDDVFLVWNSGYTTNRAATYRFPAARSLARPLNGAFVVKIVHRIAP